MWSSPYHSGGAVLAGQLAVPVKEQAAHGRVALQMLNLFTRCLLSAGGLFPAGQISGVTP